MRHSVYGKKLGRDKNQRQALFRGLVRSLILEESIETTEIKAKSIKGLVDRLISKGRSNTQASQNVINQFLTQPEVAKKLLSEIAPRYSTRSSGFTRVVRLGRRLGDGAMMVKMSLVEADKEAKEANKNAKVKDLTKKEVVKEIAETKSQSEGTK